jgi:hypothetical protein
MLLSPTLSNGYSTPSWRQSWHGRSRLLGTLARTAVTGYNRICSRSCRMDVYFALTSLVGVREAIEGPVS